MTPLRMVRWRFQYPSLMPPHQADLHFVHPRPHRQALAVIRGTGPLTYRFIILPLALAAASEVIHWQHNARKFRQPGLMRKARFP